MRIFSWVCLFFCLGISPIFADEIVVIDDAFNEGALVYATTRMLITDETDFETIRRQFEHGDFSPRGTHHIPGHARNVWIQLTLNNKIGKHVFFEFDYPLLDSITVYSFPLEDETALATYRTGDSYPFSSREFKVYNFIVPVQTPSESQVFIHIHSTGHLYSDFRIWLSKDRIYQKNLRHYLFFGIYFGIMVAMILYNVFLFINIREITYLYYVFYITAFLCSTLVFYGFASPLVFHESTYWPQVLINLFFPATGLFLVLFSKHYLNTAEHTPKLNVLLNVFILLFLVPICLFYVKSLYTYLTYYIAFLAFAVPLYIFAIAVYLSFTFKYKPAVYYLIAISSLGAVFLLCAVAWWTQYEEVLPFSYGIPIGSAMEVILFSIGLADKINTYRKEKSRMQNDIIGIQKKAYRDIEEKNKELKRLDTLKDEFLANTTHEIKTPLHAIIGIVDFLLDRMGLTENSDHYKYNLLLVKHSAKRLALILNDILDYSKMKFSKIALNCEPVNIKEISENVVYMSRFLIINKSITIHNHIGDNLPEVLADKNRLQQIIHNLMQNAITYTRKGSIELSATTQGGAMEVSISDTGIGIPEKDSERIFKSFEQAGHEGGTGLGLSITKSLITLHGGRLWHEKNMPRGSRFTFTLPIACHEGSCKTLKYEQPVPPIHPVSIENQYRSSSNPTILAVDDEILNLHVLSSIFKDTTYNVIYCQSGREALSIMACQKPDIILLDVMMPGMDGFQVASAIRENSSPVDLPIIFLSVKNQEKDILNGLTLGGNDYIAKPFSKGELLVRIKNLLFIKQLVTNSDLLHDLYILSSNNIIHISTENRIPYLYTSFTDKKKRKLLLSPISTLKLFYGEERLLQINRSCLINPQKITNVIKHTIGTNVKYQVEIGGQLNFPLTQSNLDNVQSLFPEFF